MESKTGIWRVGILLEASYLPQLKKSPMRLIRPVTDTPAVHGTVNAGVVTLCKSGLLKTYQYVNDYITPSPAGCVLHAVDQCAGQYPSMLAVPLVAEVVDSEELFKHLSLSPQDLHLVTGLPQLSEPVVLLTSQHLMESYGFFSREQVWFRWYCPALLEAVIFVPMAPVYDTAADIKTVVLQLFEKAEKECMLVHQGFNFVFQAHLDGRDVELIINALDCSPVLQGRITKDTLISFVPPTGGQFSKRRRSTREETRNSKVAASVSKPHSECEDNVGSHGYKVEAISVQSFRLPSHYIVLPKETATKHLIFNCQNVWVEAVEDDRLVSNISDVTLPLSTQRPHQKTGKRGHVVVAFLYEEECELEKYVPPFFLGSEYDTAALTVAYLHPEMLFFLFPETLASSRHYFINIKVSLQQGGLSLCLNTFSVFSEPRLHCQR